MLGSLARKLRVFGFDALYFQDGEDSELLKLAGEQGRVILTSDRGLCRVASSAGVASLLIEGGTDRARLRALASESRRIGLELYPGETRCAECNDPLQRLTKASVLTRVPQRVVSRHRSYFGCRNCGKLYWKGSHWKRLWALSAILKADSQTRVRRGDPPPPDPRATLR